jgi:high-affinity Fe2+/Pb2+ permease
MENLQSSFLKQLQVLFGAMLTGLTMASAIFYFFVKRAEVEQTEDILTTFIPLIMLALLVSGYFLFNMRRKVWAEETDLAAKKAVYRTSSLIKWAMFEGATMLALIGYFFLDIDVLLVGLVLSLAHFALHFPSRERVSRELGTDDLE